MAKPIAKYWTKAIHATPGLLEHSFNWLCARRTWLKLYDDRLEYGNKTIPYNSIEKSTLYTSRQMFIKVYILEIITKDTAVQFGLNPWVNIEKILPLEHTKEKIRLKYSKFSIVVRILLFILIFQLLYEQFHGIN